MFNCGLIDDKDEIIYFIIFLKKNNRNNKFLYMQLYKKRIFRSIGNSGRIDTCPNEVR